MNKRGVRIMNVWKRLLGGLLAGSLALSLAACGQAGGSSVSAGDQSRGEVSVSQETSGSGGSAAPDASGTQEPQAAPEGGTLVVYFSATGNTQAVAGYIADALGADLFEITPADPYTSEDLNWTDESSRVNAEHDDPALQTVELESTSVENWDSYDTVFIDYPIWWGVPPGRSAPLWRPTILPERPWFPSAPRPAPAWEKAASCWRRRREPVPGWRDSGSAAVFRRRML